MLQDLREFATVVAGRDARSSRSIFFFNFFWSLFSGKKAGRNPWKANTLEWTTDVAAAARQLRRSCRPCYRGPYEYSVPGPRRRLLAAEPAELSDAEARCPHETDRNDAQRRGIPTGRLAVWWVIASEIVIFGGLLGSYIMHRLGHPEWADAGRAHQHVDRRVQHLRAADLEPVRGARAPGGRAAATARRRRKLPLATRASARVTFLVVKAFEWTIEI